MFAFKRTRKRSIPKPAYQALRLEQLETRFCLSTTGAMTSGLGGQFAASQMYSASQAAPVITSFTATQGSDNIWTFSGTISDLTPSSVTVTLSGLIKAQVAVASNGSFNYSVQLASGASGYVYAQAVDQYDQLSGVAEVLVQASILNTGGGGTQHSS
jgi:hypothetical protein